MNPATQKMQADALERARRRRRARAQSPEDARPLPARERDRRPARQGGPAPLRPDVGGRRGPHRHDRSSIRTAKPSREPSLRLPPSIGSTSAGTSWGIIPTGRSTARTSHELGTYRGPRPRLRTPPETQFIALHVGNFAETSTSSARPWTAFRTSSSRSPPASASSDASRAPRAVSSSDTRTGSCSAPTRSRGRDDAAAGLRRLLYEIYFRFLETEDEYFDYAPAPVPRRAGGGSTGSDCRTRS